MLYCSHLNQGAARLINVKNYYSNQGFVSSPSSGSLLDYHQEMIINDIVETLNLSGLYRKVSSEGHPGSSSQR